MGKSSKRGKTKPPKPPKAKCCVSKDRCGRCPIRMLKEGTLPEGLAVKKRVVVLAETGQPVKSKKLKKLAA